MTTKPEEPGKAFMIGVGRVGALLMDITGGPCLRLDESRWSMNTSRGNLILSQRVVDRLLLDGWVAVKPKELMDRDLLVATEKGTKEIVDFALMRSMEIAAIDPPSVPSVGEERPPVTAQSLVYHLAEKAFALHFRTKGEIRPFCCVGVTVDGGETYIGIDEWLKGAGEQRGARMARLFAAIEALAAVSVVGLTIAEMGAAARWAGVIAAEAFERAPDQDWEVDSDAA